MSNQVVENNAFENILASLGKKYSENGNIRKDYLRRSATVFHLPDRGTAFETQANLMEDISEAIERKEIGFFEIAKFEKESLSLVCSICTWIEEDLKVDPELNTAKDRLGSNEITKKRVHTGSDSEKIKRIFRTDSKDDGEGIKRQIVKRNLLVAPEAVDGHSSESSNTVSSNSPEPMERSGEQDKGNERKSNTEGKAKLIDILNSDIKTVPKVTFIWACRTSTRFKKVIEDFNTTCFVKRDFAIYELKEDSHLTLDGDKQVQVIVMYYNSLLDAKMFQSLKINLSRSIILMDEAYCLPEYLASEKGVVLTKKNVDYAIGELQKYLRFPLHVFDTVDLESSKLLRLLKHINKYCSMIMRLANESDSIEVKEFLCSIGTFIDQETLGELESWYEYVMQKSVHTTKTLNQAQGEKQTIESILPIIRTFINNLIHPDYEGVIHIPDPTYVGETQDKHVLSQQGKKQWSLKYQLLNPAAVLKEIFEQARSVLLIGDAMAPMTDSKLRIVPQIKCTAFKVKHYPPFVSKENFLIGSVKYYSENFPLHYIYKTREEERNMRQLLKMITEYCKVTPDGVVVFLTAYEYLNTLRAFWYSDKAEDLFTELESTKNVFFDSIDSKESTVQLQKYKDSISLPSRSSIKSSERKGAIILTVINSKLSEEFDYKNRLARTVIFVGLPFAYMGAEMKETRRYIDKNWGSSGANAFFRIEQRHQKRPKPGESYYINLCIKSVQRTFSRINAHPQDYTAVILLDERYGESRYKTAFSDWICSHLKEWKYFYHSMQDLKAFFKSQSK